MHGVFRLLWQMSLPHDVVAVVLDLLLALLLRLPPPPATEDEKAAGAAAAASALSVAALVAVALGITKTLQSSIVIVLIMSKNIWRFFNRGISRNGLSFTAHE
mmetsp:Transcript_7235/g.14199  ORF Transcript_7235/g.14199 Transcript_7235/m.14199 type:complete len:103 (-) Transcript_7235:628-936(-)